MKWMATMGLLSLVLGSSVALAQPDGGGREGKGRPPPEALEACEGKAAGAACSFDHGDEQVEGTCFTPAEDKPLACRPDHAPSRQG